MSNTNGDTREALAAKLRGYIGQVEFARRQYVLLTPDEAKAILAALTEQPAAPQGLQTLEQTIDRKLDRFHEHDPSIDPEILAEAQRVVAAAPQALTDEQIDRINCSMWASCPLDLPQGRMFARAIERAHGIGAAPAAPAQEPQQPARGTRMPPASIGASDEWEA